MRRVLCTLALVAAMGGIAVAADMVDNEMFKIWNECGVGSWVTMKTNSEFAGNKSGSEATSKLIDKNAEKLTVETTTTMDPMMIQGKEYKQPPSTTKMEVKAKVEKVEAKGEKPKFEEGNEETEVGGKKLKCHWVKVHSETNGMITDSKSWTSPEIPGHTAKMESTTSGSMKGTTKMEATKWEKK